MQYGYFDDERKEYVITRPDTPRPWSNYLGSLEYGAIVTNNAGGYSFYKSALSSRFLRLRSNSVPMDQPGRYFICGMRPTEIIGPLPGSLSEKFGRLHIGMPSWNGLHGYFKQVPRHSYGVNVFRAA